MIANEEVKEKYFRVIGHDVEEKSRSEDVLLAGENCVSDFYSLNLSENVLRGLEMCRMKHPSPIQLSAIPYGKFNHDLIIQSKSGTGKTAVFSIISLEKVDVSKNEIQCVIVNPTREIAVQSCDVINSLGQCIEGLQVHCFIGGLNLLNDLENLTNCHIAVGTPGRLAHLVNEGMNLKNVKLFVFDEADKMLESLFNDDLERIFKNLPSNTQIIACSATFPEDVENFITKYISDPVKIQLDKSMPMLLGVREYGLDVRKLFDTRGKIEKDELFALKYKCIREIIKKVNFNQMIIFSTIQETVERIYDKLLDDDLDAVRLSSYLDQRSRLDAMKRIRSGESSIMVATDLASRGLDFENLDLVINWEIPIELSTYIHRIGRAGRFGSRGRAMTFLAYSGEWKFLHEMHIEVNTHVYLIDTIEKLDALKIKLSEEYEKEEAEGEDSFQVLDEEEEVGRLMSPEDKRHFQHWLEYCKKRLDDPKKAQIQPEERMLHELIKFDYDKVMEDVRLLETDFDAKIEAKRPQKRLEMQAEFEALQELKEFSSSMEEDEGDSSEINSSETEESNNGSFTDRTLSSSSIDSDSSSNEEEDNEISIFSSSLGDEDEEGGDDDDEEYLTGEDEDGKSSEEEDGKSSEEEDEKFYDSFCDLQISKSAGEK